MTTANVNPEVYNAVPQTEVVIQPKPTKSKNILLFVIVGVLILCICSLIGLFLVLPFVSNYSSQRSLDSFIESVDEDWIPSPDQITPPPPLDDSEDDLFTNEPGTLPFSSEFSAEMMFKDRLLGPSDGFGSEFIAIGGNPHVFNFSILKPLGWIRDTMTTEEYSYTDQISSSRVGVFYRHPLTQDFIEYSSCKNMVTKLLGEVGEGVDVDYGDEEEVVIDGKTWSRIALKVKAQTDKGKVDLRIVDQCYKDQYGLFLVYSFFSDNLEMETEQRDILDDFIFRKVN
jgi:hypothetical protein